MRDPSRADHNPSPTIARITGRLSFLDQPRYVKCNIQCICRRAQMLELRDELNQQIEGLEFVMPSNIAFVIDILPAGWSKGVAVRELAEALGVSIDEVAVFGDSENDLSMIEAVPNSVAVSNASAEILALPAGISEHAKTMRLLTRCWILLKRHLMMRCHALWMRVWRFKSNRTKLNNSNKTAHRTIPTTRPICAR
jgi:hypothetical protein